MVLRIRKTLAENTASSEDALLVHALVKLLTHPWSAAKEFLLRSADYIEGRKPLSPLGFIKTNKLNILAEVDICFEDLGVTVNIAPESERAGLEADGGGSVVQ